MKYELTNETIQVNELTLHRIRRISNGELGGFIESEHNLSQSGECWVGDEAQVCDKARIYGKAQVCSKARVYGEARVYGQAQVYGKAVVSGKAQVYGEARVYGEAVVSKSSINLIGLAYTVTITDNFVRIGCQQHSAKDWSNFSDDLIMDMDGQGALKFWADHRQVILTLAEIHQKTILTEPAANV